MSKEYVIQPSELTSMIVEADEFEVCESGVTFFVEDEMVFFAPHVNTKYITIKGKANRYNQK